MDKKTIKLYFTDFWAGFDKRNNFFTNLLSRKFNIVIDERNPDYLIYAHAGYDFKKYDCIRIHYAYESYVPDFNTCDYAISYHFLSFEDRHIRYPNFLTFGKQPELLLKPRNFSKDIMKSKQEFCNFIYSNRNAHPIRDQFFHRLSEYKKVHSVGRHLTNMDRTALKGPNWAESKAAFQKRYKFTIAFENAPVNGFITGRLMSSFITGTVPIYWGYQKISQDFNNKAIINVHDFDTIDEVIDEIIRLDNNDDEYLKVLNQPVFCEGNIPEYFDQDYLLGFFEYIFNQPLEKAQRRLTTGFSIFTRRAYLGRLLFSRKFLSIGRRIKKFRRNMGR